MNIVVPARRFLARRPWVYWIAVGVAAGVTALGVWSRLDAVDAERDRWGESRSVLVAEHDLEPGDVAAVVVRDLPVVAIPSGALAGGATVGAVRQRVRAGEVLVDADIVDGRGPGALAEPGQVVVAVSDPLVATGETGLDVTVYGDGLVLSADATIVGSLDGVLWIAVAASDGPIVAAAARAQTASIAFRS